MNKKEEIKASVILSGIVAISFIVNYILSKSTNIIWIIVFASFIITLLISIIRSKYSNRLIVLLNNIFSFPLAIFYALLKISYPVGTIVIHAFSYYLIAFLLPLIFKLSNDHFQFIKLSFEKFIFLSLTFSTIVSITFYKYIIYIVYKMSPIGINDSEKEEKLKLKKMVEYVLTPQNIRFFIYSIYFVYLCIFSYNYIDGKSSFAAKSTYSAIMQAFLAFLAFDSLRINSKEIRFLPTILLARMKEIFFYEEEIKSKQSNNPKNG